MPIGEVRQFLNALFTNRKQQQQHQLAVSTIIGVVVLKDEACPLANSPHHEHQERIIHTSFNEK